MSIGNRKSEHKKKVYNKILETTLKLITTKGIEHVSIRKIAAKIEYSPGTIYLYFKNKEAIITQLCQNGFNELNIILNETSGINDPYQRLAKIGVLFLNFAIENTELYHLMFVQSALIKNKKNENGFADEIFNVVQNTIDENIKLNTVKSNNIELTSYIYISALHGIITLYSNKNIFNSEVLKEEAFIKKSVYQLIGFLWK